MLRRALRRLAAAWRAFWRVLREGDRVRALPPSTNTHEVRRLSYVDGAVVDRWRPAGGGEATRRVEWLKAIDARWQYIYNGGLRDWGPRQ